MIKERRNLKISEISEILHVSDMTVHRDLKNLLDEGLVMKTFGGITLVRDEPGETQRDYECVLCHCQINSRFAYKLILPNNKIEDACCAHCGIIRHYQLQDQVIQAICNDFLTSTTVSAFNAWFVIDSCLKVGCCRPQILSFETKEYAEKFAQSFGGNVMSFKEITEKICGKKARKIDVQI